MVPNGDLLLAAVTGYNVNDSNEKDGTVRFSLIFDFWMLICLLSEDFQASEFDSGSPKMKVKKSVRKASSSADSDADGDNSKVKPKFKPKFKAPAGGVGGLSKPKPKCKPQAKKGPHDHSIDVDDDGTKPEVKTET